MKEEKKLIPEKYKDDIIDWISDIAKAVNILDNSASYLKSEKNTIKFLKTRKVKSPTRAFETDAGIDFYVPEFTHEFVELLREKNPKLSTLSISKAQEDSAEDDCIILAPSERVLIPSGIHCQMKTHNRMLAAFNKSGIASKFGLVAGACIDGETIIETNKGKFTAKTLTKDFIEKNKILIKGYDEQTKKYSFYNFDGFFITGEKPCIKFIFDNNEELICSEDHLLLTENGWKKAKDILLTDMLIQ